ncbi:MAG: hypothetical protein CML05_15165 [Pseudozobellia sp.]|nr:hypothetical protein [Pseudozobellia sp.]|tara:strand:+ start:2537 stop:3712 length:1176 start_codon:yes stop_codon:yes gene_type:complete
MKGSYLEHQTEISAHIVLLCRFLRKKGYVIGPVEQVNAILALGGYNFNEEAKFILVLQTVLAKNKQQYIHFKENYLEFKHQLKQASDSKVKTRKTPVKNRARQEQERFDALKSWLNLSEEKEIKETASFSGVEVLAKKEFTDLSDDEVRLIMRLLKKMALKAMRKKSRLKKHTKRRSKIDLKRTIRQSLRKGGDIQQLLYSEPKDKKLKLLLLCDVSKSMDLFSRFFIHLIYAFQNSYDKIETFVFSTALHRVSDILNGHDFENAFQSISDRVPQWSGGTTIGECLEDFVENYSYRYRYLDKKTIVLILSDGWDTGKPTNIQRAMHHIFKSSRKVVWLNPLAGNKNFSPEVLGMKSALPYIDELAPAHNLESLKKVLLLIGKRRKKIAGQF